MTTVSSATSAATTTTAASSSSSLALGTTDFLKLLMTQLTNQNPLDPTDPTEFTSQLATYSGLEQQISTNTTLSTMSDTMSSLLTQVQLLASGQS
jgi:flagellar basal-body rod modification protein FlgD